MLADFTAKLLQLIEIRCGTTLMLFFSVVVLLELPYIIILLSKLVLFLITLVLISSEDFVLEDAELIEVTSSNCTISLELNSRVKKQVLWLSNLNFPISIRIQFCLM